MAQHGRGTLLNWVTQVYPLGNAPATRAEKHVSRARSHGLECRPEPDERLRADHPGHALRRGGRGVAHARGARHGGLVADWNRPFTKLSFDEKQELQERLTELGYYDGKVDGRIGEGSKAAIRAFQSQVGLTQDGHPSMEVLKVLRQR